MRDPSPYAGQTVQLRPDAAEIGGLAADVVDWYERTGQGITWRQALDAEDFRAQGYAVRRGLRSLPDDDEVLFARVDGMGRIIHFTEIVGATVPTPAPIGSTPTPVTPSEVGEPCLACNTDLAVGDLVAVVVLGPGADPQARVLAATGQPYNPKVIELHWACRTGDESYQTAEA